MKVKSYVQGSWFESTDEETPIYNAVSGEKIGETSANGLDYQQIVHFAKTVGGPNLKKLTIHERALQIKKLALILFEKKEHFYKLSYQTGATRPDSWIDIEGGIGTLFTISSRARRELSDGQVHVEGSMEMLSRKGSFVGQHVYVPLQGVAVHINAFNFPIWGMLEKLAPTIIAGMPAIVKPSPVGSYLAEAVVKEIINSNLLPEGSVQFISADVPGDLLNHLDAQDIIAFTGSAHTGQKLKSHPNVIANNVRVNLEADSLNCSILGEDVTTDMPEFGLYVNEVYREMTSKCGQKCTAIRRALVPEKLLNEVVAALSEKLENLVIGNPTERTSRMGALASSVQADRFSEGVAQLANQSELAFGSLDDIKLTEISNGNGAFVRPVVLTCKNPLEADIPHEVEAFGPVTTLMPYKSTEEAITIANKGKGSLVGSLFTHDDDLATKVVLGIGPWHGRVMVINRDCAKESTGHGSPMPGLVHGGPGRAGGGEELGGARAVLHFMQRIALQGSPTTLMKITEQYMKGAKGKSDRIHPFQKYFEELEIGETLWTHRRTVTEADVVNFGCLSGDHFYAHMDKIGAADSLFAERVAHGYFIVSAAAGMFVSPAPGPMMANYGLENLRFLTPVKIGDTIQVKLTVKSKARRPFYEGDDQPKGVVYWDVEVYNQRKEITADYTILTIVERQNDDFNMTKMNNEWA